MKKKIRRQILSKTKRIAVISNSKNETILKCEICTEESVLLTPVLVAGLLKISTRKIYRLIEDGFVHFYEDDSKKLLVCFSSIEGQIAKKG